MTLREKFNRLIGLKVGAECEKIADDFAIEFAKWIINENYYLDFCVNNEDIKELLEIYKKEKRLYTKRKS